VLDVFQRFSVDLCRYVAHVDEIDVSDVIRSASPPVAARHSVAVDEDVRRPDVLMHSEEAEVLEERHALVHTGVIRAKHDVVYNVRYRETLGIINTNNRLSYRRETRATLCIS